MYLQVSKKVLTIKFQKTSKNKSRNAKNYEMERLREKKRFYFLHICLMLLIFM